MAKFDIISKDGASVRFSGKLRYVGTYLKPSYVEFSEISSPTPIDWEIGDYVDYSRTGVRYRLYSIPQPSKNARKDSHGRAFTYSNVQLYDATKELEIALFRDLVSEDNNIHFSTSPDVATFEDVEGIARRIQACMDDFYPGKWTIQIADFDATEDAEIIEKISEAKDFALSGGTCLDALSKIYELWQDIGWIHTYDSESGKDIITIGYANKRIDANTTDAYLYGKGYGLTAIKKSQTNKDEFATRLYIYGSERNLPARFYNGLDILNAESVDIRNLMLPLDSWGMTDGLPDARKAYLENAEAVAKYGVFPKTHYFDSVEAGADIYPSIEGMTIGDIRSVMDELGQVRYYPNEDIYTSASERADEVLSADNPTDDGVLKTDGKQYDETHEINIYGEDNLTIGANSEDVLSFGKTLAQTTFERSGKGKVSVSSGMNILVMGESLSSVRATFELTDSLTKNKMISKVVEVDASLVEGSDTSWIIPIPRIEAKYDREDYDSFPAYLVLNIYITPLSGAERPANVYYPSNSLKVNFSRILASTFEIQLKQIGFNIDIQAAQGEGKAISMKTGACAGRDFVISDCVYQEESDTWLLTCRRQQDDTLGMLFPYSDYPIQGGDRFVLTDIAMPDLYIYTAMQRLFSEGQKLLARASKIQSHYEPSIDAKLMVESGRSLREGMFMEISDEDVIDNVTDYILIDTLSIYEDESAIPTYKVTLRERRKVTYKGTPSATSTTSTKSVGSGETEVDSGVDLSGYATEGYVDEGILTLTNLINSMWYIDEATGELVTDRAVRVKNNHIVEGESSSNGEGTDVQIGVTGIYVDGTPYTDTNGDGYIDLTDAFENVSVDLSNYYTKSEVNELIDEITAGDIDLANYYTKSEVDAKIAGIDLSPYALASDLDSLSSRVGVNEGNIATLTSGKADKATTLAGYGITDAYTKTETDNLLTTLDNKYNPVKTWYDSLSALIVAEDGNVRIKTNLIVDGDSSSGGEGGSAVAGITGITLNGTTFYDTNGDGIIDLGEITGGVTEITSAMITEALGYTPVKSSDLGSLAYKSSLGWSDIADRPTALSEFENDLGLAAVATSGSYTDLSNKPTIASLMGTTAVGSTSSFAYWDGSVWKSQSLPTSLPASDVYAWAKESTKPSYNTSEVSESGNLYFTNARAVAALSGTLAGYLPLSGGTLTGTSNTVLTVNTSATNEVGIGLRMSNVAKGWIGYNPSWGTHLYTYSGSHRLGVKDDGTGYLDSNTLIHSGNIGDYAFLKNATQLTSSNTLDADLIGIYAYKDANNPTNSFGNNAAVLSLKGVKDTPVFQLAFDGNATSVGYRNRNYASTWSTWKTIAFTDSNVASATKLETARTIWGQSFDGTGNVTGNLYLGSNILYGGNNYNILDISGGTSLNIGYGIRSVGSIVYWAKSHTFYVGDSHALAINSSGNVGIGTSTPSYKLHVIGTLGVSGVASLLSNLVVGGNLQMGNEMPIYFKDKDGNNKNSLFISTGNNMWLGYDNGTSIKACIVGSEVRLYYGGVSNIGLLLNSSGNIGIGNTSPSYKVDINGEANINGGSANLFWNCTGSSYSLGFGIGSGNTNRGIYDFTNASWLLYRDATTNVLIPQGNVGIGTTSPSYKLDVNGNQRISGNLIVTGEIASA